nr:immunoglobulin heavy chain junction region [Mus musculus]
CAKWGWGSGYFDVW